jgi:hypothetical protein
MDKNKWHEVPMMDFWRVTSHLKLNAKLHDEGVYYYPASEEWTGENYVAQVVKKEGEPVRFCLPAEQLVRKANPRFLGMDEMHEHNPPYNFKHENLWEIEN